MAELSLVASTPLHLHSGHNVGWFALSVDNSISGLWISCETHKQQQHNLPTYYSLGWHMKKSVVFLLRGVC